jgi:Protein of unknown function (DUF2844)
MSHIHRIRAVIFASLAACQCLPAAAALGGTVDTVQSDVQTMRATRRVATHPGYDVHELTLASGTVVREFVGPGGTVFGVAWQGPIKPDLEQLLGTGFPRLVAAARVPHGDHRSLAVRAPDLVVESGGRMRNFAGRAYLPALVPASVSVADIR